MGVMVGGCDGGGWVGKWVCVMVVGGVVVCGWVGGCYTGPVADLSLNCFCHLSNSAFACFCSLLGPNQLAKKPPPRWLLLLVVMIVEIDNRMSKCEFVYLFVYMS